MFLRWPRTLSLSALHTTEPSPTRSTSSESVPSAHRIFMPGDTLLHSLAYEQPTTVSPVASSLKPSKLVYSAPTAASVTSWPATMAMSCPPRSMAVRISGPLVSSIVAMIAPFASATCHRWWL